MLSRRCLRHGQLHRGDLALAPQAAVLRRRRFTGAPRTMRTTSRTCSSRATRPGVPATTARARPDLGTSGFGTNLTWTIVLPTDARPGGLDRVQASGPAVPSTTPAACSAAASRNLLQFYPDTIATRCHPRRRRDRALRAQRLHHLLAGVVDKAGRAGKLHRAGGVQRHPRPARASDGDARRRHRHGALLHGRAPRRLAHHRARRDLRQVRDDRAEQPHRPGPCAAVLPAPANRQVAGLGHRAQPANSFVWEIGHRSELALQPFALCLPRAGALLVVRHSRRGPTRSGQRLGDLP